MNRLLLHLPLLAILPTGLYFYFFFKRICQTWVEPTLPIKIILSILTICFVMPLTYIWGVWTVIVYYLLAFCLLTDLIVWLVKKSQNYHTRLMKIYHLGIIPILCLMLTLGYGYYHMKDIHVQQYSIYTQKQISQNYRVVLMTDLHFGNTMNKDELKTYCQQISLQKPDLVLLGGDIVDERSTHQQMLDAFEVLGDIKSQYGIYYVYGNHDEARYARTPHFSMIELAQTIEENDIHILSDQVVNIHGGMILAGRNDRSYGQRETSQDLLKKSEDDRFILMLDHQPVDLKTNDELGVDLQLSGHTHGGQMFPVGVISNILGFGEMNYGYRQMSHMQVIVSSGIAGWGYPLRTGSQSEYVIVDILKQ